MKICIYGAGAIGGYLGVELTLAGLDVTLIARGPHLDAMKKNGLKLLIDDGEKVAHPRCTDDPEEAGPQVLRYKQKKLLQKCFLDPLPQQLYLLEPVGSAEPVP